MRRCIRYAGRQPPQLQSKLGGVRLRTELALDVPAMTVLNQPIQVIPNPMLFFARH